MSRSSQGCIATRADERPVRRMSDALEQLEAAAFSWCKHGFMMDGGAALAIWLEFAIYQANSVDEQVPCELHRKDGFLADAYAI